MREMVNSVEFDDLQHLPVKMGQYSDFISHQTCYWNAKGLHSNNTYKTIILNQNSSQKAKLSRRMNIWMWTSECHFPFFGLRFSCCCFKCYWNAKGMQLERDRSSQWFSAHIQMSILLLNSALWEEFCNPEQTTQPWALWDSDWTC